MFLPLTRLLYVYTAAARASLRRRTSIQQQGPLLSSEASRRRSLPLTAPVAGPLGCLRRDTARVGARKVLDVVTKLVDSSSSPVGGVPLVVSLSLARLGLAGFLARPRRVEQNRLVPDMLVAYKIVVPP